jgi:hypothetical protein
MHAMGSHALSGAKVERERLDHRQRADGLGPTPGTDQAHDRAVRVADQVGDVTEELGDIVRIPL